MGQGASWITADPSRFRPSPGSGAPCQDGAAHAPMTVLTASARIRSSMGVSDLSPPGSATRTGLLPPSASARPVDQGKAASRQVTPREHPRRTYLAVQGRLDRRPQPTEGARPRHKYDDLLTAELAAWCAEVHEHLHGLEDTVGVELLLMGGNAASLRFDAIQQRGKTNPQIAEQLLIARSTVKTHLSSIYRKLDVANRTELALATGVRSSGDPAAR